MQKKVYISSTFEDLQKYRSALYSALRKMAYDVQAMEDYVARDDRLVHRCLADVAACDFYIGIFAHRYGWIPPEDNPSQLSITELEYRRARETHKTCLLFLLDPKAAWPQTFMDSETGGGHAGADIQRLRAELSNYSYGLFGTPEELVINAMAALYLCEAEVPVDQQGKPPALSTPAMARIPRPPAVGFVARRDRQGRDILARLKDELTPERRQLVALWGAGGVGKTTLAAEAARAWVAQFGSRMAWVSAERRADFTLASLLGDVAVQLGKPDLPQSGLDADKMKVQVRALLAAGPSLIVLDNFETVSPEEQIRCTEWLSNDAPCPVLVTTRDALSVKRDGVDIASNVGVDPMAVAEAQDFLERVVANQEEALAGLDRNEIIRAADNNPLVMQWIVAQIALAQTPGTVLEELASGRGDAAQRVFDRSFYLPQLGEDGRDTLLALSLFVPSASRQALAEVAGFGQDLARLNEAVRRLAALRLLSAVNAGERLAVQGLTRELTKARLDADPRASEFQRRIADFFLPYAQAHARATREDNDGLMAEKDNLLGSIELTFALLKSALDHPGSVAATADMFRRPAGAALKTMLLKDNEQPRSPGEYENVGRAAMVSLLRLGNPLDDLRRLPLTIDGSWRQMRDVGNPQSFGPLFEGRGSSSIGTAVVASDYLRIMWWAQAMSTIAKALGAIWPLLKEEPRTESENTAFQGLQKILLRALSQARGQTIRYFGGPWYLLAMARCMGLDDTVVANASAAPLPPPVR